MEKREWLIIICIAVITPALVALGVSMPGLGGIVNDTSQWIGFWGGYIGSIFGGLITLFVLQKTIRNNQDTLEKTLSVEKEREAENKKLNYFDNVCEQLLCLSADIAESSGGKSEFQKDILVASAMIDARLKSKREDADYIGCDEMILALHKLLEVYQNVLAAQAINDKNTAWNVIMLHVAQEANVFNEKVAEFYLKNIK